LDELIRADARQHMADAIAKYGLAVERLAEPDPKSDDPLSQTCAVLRLTMAVADKDEAATLAREMAEAEDRGFRKALTMLSDAAGQCEGSTDDRVSHAAYGLIKTLVRVVSSTWDHRPASDWRPMRTLPEGRSSDIEYWFATGHISRQRKLCVPRREEPFFVYEGHPPSPVTASHEEYDAVAWRYAGRPPVVEAGV
jgi:hypothetical protein